MVSDEIIEKLKERYKGIHPLMFHRSVERAKSDGDLFDILDSMPNKYPILWCETTYRWVTIDDIYQTENFLGEL
jgi:hypothetical protein